MANTSCGITGGLDLTCETLKASKGGLKQRVFVGNYGELDAATPFTYDVAGYVTAINFAGGAGYGGLYEFVGVRNQNQSNVNAVRLESGNANFPQSVTISVHDTTPAQKAVLEELAYADVFAIVETSGGQFVLLGADLGLGLESAEKASGTSPADSSARTVVLSGDQTSIEKVVLDTDYATTVAYLESLLAA